MLRGLQADSSGSLFQTGAAGFMGERVSCGLFKRRHAGAFVIFRTIAGGKRYGSRNLRIFTDGEVLYF